LSYLTAIINYLNERSRHQSHTSARASDVAYAIIGL